MKENASASWRKQGESDAFDHGAWEWRSCYFVSAADHLLSEFDQNVDAPTADSITLLPVAEFLLSLAVELISKAYYLKRKSGPEKAIYSHSVVSLFDKGFFTNSQLSLMNHAENYVVWAGRYPTPQWMRERHKEGYDVPAIQIDGVETIDAGIIPNSASRHRAGELRKLYDLIHEAWSRQNDA